MTLDEIKAKATKRPWMATTTAGAYVEADRGRDISIRNRIADCDDHRPYIIDDEGKANAALIAQAVNNFEPLLAAAKDAMDVMTRSIRGEVSMKEAADLCGRLQKAIEKAEAT